MELCRFEIRSILKKKVSREHPDLWQRSRKHAKESGKRSIMRRCVVPLFANSDSDSDTAAEMEVDANEGGEQESLTDSSSDSEPENQDESADRRVRLAEALSDSEESNSKTKREKFDSGVGDLFESPNAQCRLSNQSVATDSTGSSSPVEPSASVSNADIRVNHSLTHSNIYNVALLADE